LRRLGGASEIVKRHVDSALDALTTAERDAAARIFQSLVTPAGSKIALGVDDLYPNAGMSAEQLRALLIKLSLYQSTFKSFASAEVGIPRQSRRSDHGDGSSSRRDVTSEYHPHPNWWAPAATGQ